MRIEGTRFGDIEIEDARIVELANGMIGFPTATRYVLLPSPSGGAIGWLQSVDEPSLAFPVLDATAVGAADYPAPGARELAASHGLGGEDIATLVVVVPSAGGGVDANLLAPIIVDVAARRGQQVVLDPKRYAARAHVVV